MSELSEKKDGTRDDSSSKSQHGTWASRELQRDNRQIGEVVDRHVELVHLVSKGSRRFRIDSKQVECTGRFFVTSF